MTLALHPKTIAYPDNPLSPYMLPRWQSDIRVFLPYIETGRSDDEAWEALFSDDQRLDVFRTVYGNRKGPVPKRSVPQLALFEEVA